VIAVHAAKNRDISVRATSSSGGVFRALCNEAVDRGSAVYGARYDSVMRVVHARALTMDECRAFSGSKYVQSHVGASFAQVREDLKAGKSVLFSGTPCQVAGLKSYLSVTRVAGNLLTVDVVCHGVTSPMLFRDHLNMIEAKHGQQVHDFLFRDKEGGWRGVHYRAVTVDGPLTGGLVAAFGDLFNHNCALRPSCHGCPFANLDRVADLTIGDYWGIERHLPEFDDDRGVSIVLVNTEAGRRAFELIRVQLECIEIEVEQCLQPNLVRPTPPSRHRASFWKTYHRAGYESAIKRYTSYGFLRRNARRLRQTLRRAVQ